MKLNSFKEILIKKSFDNASLQDFIQDISTEELFEYVSEVLEKMASKKQPNGALIDYAHNFNINDADHIHGQLSHHASKYSAAMRKLNSMPEDSPATKNVRDVANQHMGNIFKTMHLLHKITKDGSTNHTDPEHNQTISNPGAESYKMSVTDADGKSEPISPDAWTRNLWSSMKPGATNPYQDNSYTTAVRGWNVDTKKFDFMSMPPHHARVDHISRHGENGAYPLERLKVDGHHLDINPDEEFTGKFESHYYDKHPIFKMMSNPKEKLSDADNETYKRMMGEFHDSMSDPKTFENHVDRIRQEKMPPKAVQLHPKHSPLDIDKHTNYSSAGMHEKDFEDAVSQLQSDPSKAQEIFSKYPKLKEAISKDSSSEIKKQSQKQQEEKSYGSMDDVHEEMYNMLKDNPELENELFDNEDQKKEYQDYLSRTKLNKSNELTQIEFLLKSISGLINKNKSFFTSNPEIFNVVQERFIKAVNDESEEEFDPYEYAQKDQTDEEPQDEDTSYAEDTASLDDEEPTADEKNSKRMSGWAPKEKYTDKQLADIKNHMNNGFSHREAERMANAHDFHSDPWKTNYTNPNQPSDTLINLLQPHFKEHLRLAGDKQALESKASDAPVIASHAQSIAARKTEHQTKMRGELNEYLKSIRSLPVAKRAQLEAAWKKDYVSKNPEVHEELGQNISSASDIRSKAFQERGKSTEQGAQDVASAISGQSFSPEVDQSPKYSFKHSDTMDDGTEHHHVTENGKSHGFVVHHPNKPHETEFLPAEGSEANSEDVVNSFNNFKTSSDTGMGQEDLNNVLREIGNAHSKMRGELGKYQESIKHMPPAQRSQLESEWKKDYSSKNPDVNVTEILNKHPKLKSHIFKLKSSGEGESGEQEPQSEWSGYRGFEPEGKQFGTAVQDIYGGSSDEEGGGGSNIGMSVESDPYSTLHGKIQSMTPEGRQKLIEKNPNIKQKLDKLNETQKQRMSHIESVRPSSTKPAQPAQPTQPKGAPSANIKNV
jgi:hypothetical protein